MSSFSSRTAPERVDALVVGGRCAGSAAAVALARRGRHVLVVERGTLPSDTLSTHLNFPSAVAELKRLGALERVQALARAPELRRGMVTGDGVVCRNRFRAVDGIDFALSNPRTELDLALSQTAQAAGAEVRLRTAFTGLRWKDGRVAGARLRSRDGVEYDVDAPIVIGADGRRSSVAYHAGAERPYRGSRNGRGCAFFYADDPQLGTEWRETAALFRGSETHTLVFPCPNDRMVVLFMGPTADLARWRREPMAKWGSVLAGNDLVRERLAGAGKHSKLRSTAQTSAYFRRATGPGWALAGDAAHFKDPLIGQGIRDALRFGRLLGEAIAATLGEDPVATDRAALAVEQQRERECLATYHWGNRESRSIPDSALTTEALRWADDPGGARVTEMFDRVRAPHHVLNPLRGAQLVARAALRPGCDRRALLRAVADELRIDRDIWREELLRPVRAQRPAASERRDGFEWPSAAPSSAPARAEREMTAA